MTFLIVILIIRLLTALLDNANRKEVKQKTDTPSIKHPAEFEVR